MYCACVVSVSPVTDVSYPCADQPHQTSIASRRWAPATDVDSVSFVESLSDSDADDQRSVVVLLLLCVNDVVKTHIPVCLLLTSFMA